MFIFIKVWGCGGEGVKEKQDKQQQWERKQAEKLQKVKCKKKIVIYLMTPSPGIEPRPHW